MPEGDLEAFLGSLAQQEGALHRRGAVVDLVGAARALVRDWMSGRLAWYTLLSSPLGKQEEGGEGRDPETETERRRWTRSFARSMRSMKKCLLLAGVLPRKEVRRIRGGLVQPSCGKVDERTVDLEATVEVVESDSDEEAESAFGPSVKGAISKASKGSLSPRAVKPRMTKLARTRRETRRGLQGVKRRMK